MKSKPLYMDNPGKHEIATEVLSSAIRVLQAAGFDDDEIPQLFDQVAKKPKRAPLYLEPLAG